MAKLTYWVWLSSLRGIRPITAKRLLEDFGSPEKIFFARENEYKERKFLSSRDIEILSNKSLTETHRIMDVCVENDYRILTIQDTEYPERLKNIADPPLLLYIKGRIPVMDEEPAVAVAGTRKCSLYGIRAAEQIGYEITKAGGLVISGLALGIDSAAARGALRAGGKAVGVLGSGLDVVYPPENRYLFEDVARSGALISEYPPGTPGYRSNFPRRNRILSGLALGVCVVEAPKHSGSLITVARALEQGRDIFAVPGNIDSAVCEGSNNLLKEGAFPVTSGWDIMEEYKPLYPEKLGRAQMKKFVPLDAKEEQKLVEKVSPGGGERPVSAKKVIDKDKNLEYIDLMKQLDGLSEDELAVLSVLTEERHVDDIIELSGLSAAKVLAALTLLEIKGYVLQNGGKRFCLNVSVK